ncbi:AraC family transcriptional regulator [Coraliomargarita sp. SDUM461004]|uniref:AraC family transcriptional regulator n=1 Tax=Thalassobacterium sedimentorum TaxID=3041258 RepID=A0ABU1ANP8_9BACT|nr:AraC family transcriptional regulator [Coraliomargarita sp. SDUM461004]MDQ8196423.1 AraC family transcriptional regulator [Coraliomargarita sp. SDUM461004]
MIVPTYKSILGQLLQSQLDFKEMHDAQFQSGFRTESQVIPSTRFILLIDGTIEYTVEGHGIICTAGAAIFVPPWIWRKWEVTSESPAKLIWAVFTPSQRIFNSFDHIIMYHPADFNLQKAAIERMLLLWKNDRHDLLLEGEMKAILARFFRYSPKIETAEVLSGRHPEVDYAVRWFQASYMIPSALSELQEQLTLSADYFRDLFRKQTHLSPNQYLTMLRMRAARHLLKKGAMSIKEVAAQTGHKDPLYFSRAYRKFWKCSPSEDRS